MSSKIDMSLALAQQLPCDILYLIFKGILPAVFNNTEVPDVRTLPPFNLSLVCRSWRAAVDSHPSLWSSLSVFYDSLLLPHSSRPIPFLIKHWLDRSASTRLSLEIHFLYDAPTDESNEILGLVTSQQHRWDVVGITLDRTTSHCGETIVIPCPPTLSSLTVRCVGSLVRRLSKLPMVLDLSCFDAVSVASSSRLHTLTTGKNVAWRLPPQAKAVRFSNLLKLDISINQGLLIGDVLAVLRGCPRLMTLKLHYFPVVAQGTPLPIGTELVAESVVLLPNLTTLSISAHNQAIPESFNFLDHISCPDLIRFLHVSLWTTKTEEGQESLFTLENINRFVQFFNRLCAASGSDCLPLSTLILFSTSNVVYPGDTCQQYLIAMQALFDMLGNLKALVLKGAIVNDEFMKMMSITSGTKVLLPSLEKFLFSTNGQLELHWEAVEDMVVSRCSVAEDFRARRLRSLLFRDPKLKIPDEKSVRLRRCIEEGLELGHTHF